MFLNRKKHKNNPDSKELIPSHGTTDPEVADLVDLALSHLNEIQRVGLRDGVLVGFYRNDTHEVFPGVYLGPEGLLVEVGCGSGGVLEFSQPYAGQIVASADASPNCGRYSDQGPLP